MKKNKNINTIDGNLFKHMIINGTINLQNNYHQIDNLNVFPVPDRDTGTNMKITMMSGVKEIKNLKTDSIIEVSQVLAKALLMGAKGNSGIILSQFFAGMSDTFNNLQKESININEFIDSLKGGYQKAYQAIINPSEGTILTIFRESVEKTLKQKNNFKTIIDVMENFLQNAKKTLEKTPNLLNVLKKAGVVDSGGAGFVEIVEGMTLFLKEEKMLETKDNASQKHYIADKIHNLGKVNIKYIYCTEYIFKITKNSNLDIVQIKKDFLKKGDSLVLAQDKEILKIHIHTNNPGFILEKLLEHGKLKVSKIDNMEEQHQTIMNQKKNILHGTPQNVNSSKEKYYFISFVNDSKIKKVFLELKVNHVIDKKDFIMQEFLDLIDNINAQNIIILPNDLEILNLLTKEIIIPITNKKDIVILSTKNIAQGYSVLLAFDESLDWEKNKDIMNKTIKKTQTAEIICADKNYIANNQINVNEKDYVSIVEGKIVSSNSNKYKAINMLLKKIIKPYQTFLTIFYNANTTDFQELVKIEKFLESNYNHLELETIEIENDKIPYILSLE